jgi:hypothetical protein
MFAQEIFNTLIDSFEVSHRRRRFDLNRLDLDEEDDVWIYDYSSFTSNCTEQKYFLDALAKFCEGTSIRVFDVFHGIQIIDLGVYLKEYNDECNRLAEFYLGPKIESLGIPKATYNHKRAGALGVLGNIASCTILHALLNMMITGSARKSSVVGDDGILLKKFKSAHENGEIDEWLNDPISIKNALRLFGEIADHKFAILSWTSNPYRSSWTYLKRCLVRHETSLELWDQDHILNLSLLFDNAVTLRETSHSTPALYKSFVGQVANLLLRIHRQQNQVLDDELWMICALLNNMYDKLQIPKSGSLKALRMSVKNGPYKHQGEDELFLLGGPIMQIPRTEYSHLLREDPMEALIRSHDWSSAVSVPELALRGSHQTHPEDFRIGYSVLSTSRRFLRLLVDFGYLVEEAQVIDVDENGFRDFRRNLHDRSYGILYEYLVTRQLPYHFVDALAVGI